MSVNNQQIAQAIRSIEEQLTIIKQSLGDGAVAQEGIVGVFDGEFMVEESGKRHQVPPNYASKTMLVAGDTVRMIEDKESGNAKYKQIGKVERAKSSGILVKKDGKFEVLTEEGSFKVLSASIKHYNGEVGDLVYIQYPKQRVKGGWAAVEKLVNQSTPMVATSPDVSEIQPVILNNDSVVNQASSVAHVQEQDNKDAQPNLLKKEQSAVTQPDPQPVKNKESKPKGRTEPRSKKTGANESRSRTANIKQGDKPAVNNTPKPVPASGAEVVKPEPVNVENVFGDDDLI